jgi:cyclopropane fatty-acyl-phospholipid synthase-like methyltransferase
LKNTVGITPLGLLANQLWHDDPRGLTFLLARYKFVAKMLSGRHDVGEVGCGDGFGARIVLQEVDKVSVYDPDRIFIEDIRARHDEHWPLQSHIHDILESPLPRRHDALFSLDAIEYLVPKDEHAYIANLRGSLAEEGVLIIGTRSLESQSYASSASSAARRNCKSGRQLKLLLEQYFTRVVVFSMNDEVVHTGFYPMAQYLFAVCTGPK